MIKLDHLTLQVRDHRSARDWYRSMLGLELELELPERGVAAMKDNGGFTLFLEEAPSPSPCCMLYFQIEDVDAMFRDLSARGARFVHAPRKEPWGYGAELEDVDGYRVRLWDERSMRAHGD